MVEADGAVRFFLLGEIKDHFRLIVVAELCVSGDAVAVAGVLFGIDLVSLVDVRQRLFGLAQPDQVHAQVQECFVVVRLVCEQFTVGVSRLFISRQRIERQPEPEQPVALVRVDRQCPAEQPKRVVPSPGFVVPPGSFGVLFCN